MDSCGWDLENALNLFFSAPNVPSPINESPESNNQNGTQDVNESLLSAGSSSEVFATNAEFQGNGSLRNIRLRSASSSIADVDSYGRVDTKRQRRASHQDLRSVEFDAEDETISNDRILRFEQDEAYERSLAEDRAKEEMIRLEELRKMYFSS